MLRWSPWISWTNALPSDIRKQPPLVLCVKYFRDLSLRSHQGKKNWRTQELASGLLDTWQMEMPTRHQAAQRPSPVHNIISKLTTCAGDSSFPLGWFITEDWPWSFQRRDSHSRCRVELCHLHFPVSDWTEYGLFMSPFESVNLDVRVRLHLAVGWRNDDLPHLTLVGETLAHISVTSRIRWKHKEARHRGNRTQGTTMTSPMKQLILAGVSEDSPSSPRNSTSVPQDGNRASPHPLSQKTGTCTLSPDCWDPGERPQNDPTTNSTFQNWLKVLSDAFALRSGWWHFVIVLAADAFGSTPWNASTHLAMCLWRPRRDGHLYSAWSCVFSTAHRWSRCYGTIVSEK